MQALGLQTTYTSDRGTYRFLKMVMALPFLPYHEIEPIFTRVRQQGATEPLRKFVDYVAATWISSDTWPPSSWSVYLQSIRTNNDFEFGAIEREPIKCFRV